MLEELIQFKNEYGHFMVFKKDIKKDNKKLAAWIDIQRRYRKQGLLSSEKIEKLNAISFVWDGESNYERKGNPSPKEGRGFR
ncbi:MAG: helicase associated domain-containing protein [bacterium]|nr:helicase associated domain-containing protein [bacterium]